MDVRIVGGGQNNGPVTAASVRALTRANAIAVCLVNISGDVYNAGGGSSGGGDGAILDGANSAIKATVKQLPNASPLGVVLLNASGDIYDPGSSVTGATVATYGRKNITTSPTLILDFNAKRRVAHIQNLESQQLFIGYSSSLSAIQPAACLFGTSFGSGDGAFWSIKGYQGPLYGVLATGDGDITFGEF